MSLTPRQPSQQERVRRIEIRLRRLENRERAATEFDTSTAETVVLAPDDVDLSTPIELAEAYRILAIQTSRPARVRLYSTSAAQLDDLGRVVDLDPASSAGVVLEYVTPDDALYTLSPLVDGASMEGTPTGTIPMSVDNLDAVSGTVNVTLTWLSTE